MREILFRGKRVDNDEWIFGSFCQVHDIYGNPCIIELGKNLFISVKAETVGQSTGWKDKITGKPVFEGDWYFDEAMNLHILVEWDKDDVSFKLAGYGWDEDDPRPSENPECITYEHFASILEFEVQGNIHDNPISGLTTAHE